MKSGLWLIKVGMLVVFCAFSVYAENPVEQAEAFFHQDAVGEALQLLRRTANSRRTPAVSRMQCMARLAQFSEEVTGDFEEAQQWNRKALALAKELPEASCPDCVARQQRLQAFYNQFRQENDIMDAMQVTSYDMQEIAQRVGVLSHMIAASPNYPNLGRAWYYLASTFKSLERYREAAQAYQKALALRPGLRHRYSIIQDLAYVRTQWQKIFAERAALLFSAIGWVGCILCFYRIRPLRRLGLRHGVIFGGSILFWSGATFLAGVILSYFATREAGDLFEVPIFVGAGWTDPGSELLFHAFVYGALAFLGTCLVAIGMTHARLRWTSRAFCFLLTLVFFTSAFTLFVLNDCKQATLLRPNQDGVLPNITARLILPVEELEPHIMVNPAAYPKMKTKSISDPVFAQWLEWHYNRLDALSRSSEGAE